MMKKIIYIALVVVMASSMLMFTACDSSDGDTQPTQSTETKVEDTYPSLDLDYYDDGDTKAEAENNAVSRVGREQIEESFEDNDLVESTEFDNPVIYNFDEGFVAKYDVEVKLEGSDEILEVTMFGYYVTIEQPDGTFRTYFISYEEIGQADDMSEETIEKLLQEQIDKIKKEESEEDETTKATEQEVEETTTKKADTEETTTKADEDSDEEDDPEAISEVIDDDIIF